MTKTDHLFFFSPQTNFMGTSPLLRHLNNINVTIIQPQGSMDDGIKVYIKGYLGLDHSHGSVCDIHLYRNNAVVVGERLAWKRCLHIWSRGSTSFCDMSNRRQNTLAASECAPLYYIEMVSQ